MKCGFCGKAFEERPGHKCKWCSAACRMAAQNAARKALRLLARERKKAEKLAAKEAKAAATRPVTRDQCDGCKNKGPLLCFMCRGL